MILPPFSLPCDSAKKITLREATVEDCMDFAGVARSHEEEVTTLFLNRLQDKATFVDAKTWSAESRRFGLFWYWIHTTRDHEVPTTYDCNHCGKKHTYLADYRGMMQSYRSIKGLPERNITIGEEQLVVRPLNGSDVEALEMAYLELETIKVKFGESSGEYRKCETAIRLERICRALGWVSDNDEARIKGMSVTQYNELSDKVESALDDMTHGLESTYINGALCLLLPPHQCPNVTDREATTRLWVFFRTFDYLPEI